MKSPKKPSENPPLSFRLISFACLLQWGFALLSFIWMGCSSGKAKLEVPLNMPEICQGIDFNVNIEMQEICGVKTRSFRAYRNIAEYRMLLYPKNGKIVKKADQLELRLEKTLPVELPRSWTSKIDFSERARSQYLKNKYDYQEFFPRGSKERKKILKISVPFNSGDFGEVCYSIPPKVQGISETQTGFAHKIEPLDCKKFQQLKAEAESVD